MFLIKEVFIMGLLSCLSLLLLLCWTAVNLLFILLKHWHQTRGLLPVSPVHCSLRESHKHFLARIIVFFSFKWLRILTLTCLTVGVQS